MALTSSGYVFTWGSTRFGVLGHGERSSLLPVLCLTIPCLVEGLCEQIVVHIASGPAYCAVIVDSSPSTIRQSQQESFNNKERSDVIFMVEHDPIYANT